MKKKFITKIAEVKGKLCLVLPKELIKECGWKEGDKIAFEIIDKDSFKIYKKV